MKIVLNLSPEAMRKNSDISKVRYTHRFHRTPTINRTIQPNHASFEHTPRILPRTQPQQRRFMHGWYRCRDRPQPPQTEPPQTEPPRTTATSGRTES